jgi:glutathione S-transferase
LAETGARLLYHLWLSPVCRKVRVTLAEKGLTFTLRMEKVWEPRPDFLALNPAGDVPVLVEPDGTVIAESDAICAYLDDVYRDPARPLYGSTPLLGAETRRLVAWFDRKFDREVTQHLVEQKVMKRFLGLGEPDSGAIRAGKANIRTHLDYIGYLTDRRKWLAGDEFTLADIAAAAHLSAIDYLGDVAWEDYPAAKDWYARIKSRPSFRGILADSIPGAPPPKHYADLDF